MHKFERTSSDIMPSIEKCSNICNLKFMQDEYAEASNFTEIVPSRNTEVIV